MRRQSHTATVLAPSDSHTAQDAHRPRLPKCEVSGFEGYLKGLAELPPLPREEEVRLARLAQSGDEDARAMLVAHNLRFVVMVAKRYRGFGLSLEDLVAEGNLGLLRAVDRFDVDEGVRFISYAAWWVKQGILLSLASNGKVMSLPASRASDYFRFRKTEGELHVRLGRQPTAQEIAQESTLSADVVEGLRAAHEAGVPWSSLDHSEHHPNGIDPVLIDDSLKAITERDLDRHFLRLRLEAALEELTAREAQILRLYTGFNGGPCHTLDQIARMTSLTRERVRQIRDRAYAKLRNNESLHPFATDLGLADAMPQTSTEQV